MNSIQIYKKTGRRIVRDHFFMMVVICLLAMMLQMEYGNLSALVTKVKPGYKGRRDIAVSVTMPWVQDQATDLIWMMKNGYFSSDKEMQFEKSFRPKKNDPIQLRLSREEIEKELKDGGFARQFQVRFRLLLYDIVNKLLSLHILVQLAESIRAMITSDGAASKFFIFLSLLIYLHVWTFLINVYRAIVARLVLEAAQYEKVPYHRIFYFFTVGKLGKASVTMLYVYILKLLWNLTIIGGFIKYFSYYAVPYIVAENPDIGAREAILLSRNMMHGHKWECFCYHLSFIGWYLLSFLTLGLSDIFYFCPLRVASFAAYYTDLRREAKKKLQIPELNDRWLFETPPATLLEEAYADVYEEISGKHTLSEKECSGAESCMIRFAQFGTVRSRILRWFGIWPGKSAMKHAFQEKLDTHEQRLQDIDCISGRMYPILLNPGYRAKWKDIGGRMSFRRCYTIWSLFLMFFYFCISGWVWETILHLIQTGEYVNRGTLHGPWLPIYGMGGVVVLTVLHRLQKNPAVLFFTAMVLCGSIEYTASYVLEKIYHMRWWDYTGYFMNLNGRICLEGLLVFAVASTLIVYLIGPLLDTLFSKIPVKAACVISLALLLACAGDFIYSQKVPNVGAGVTKILDEKGNYVQYNPDFRKN